MNKRLVNVRQGFIFSLLAVLWVSTFGAQEGFAQEQVSAKDQKQRGRVIEEVLITAQKRAESIQDVPIAVQALSADDLVSADIRSTQGLQALAPSLTTNFGATNVTAFMRGVGSALVAPGLEPSVAMYMDDIYLARTSSGILSFNDIARVEVLQGPQGSLYGMNTTGGAIRIITNDPTPELEAGVGLMAGNIGQRGVDGYISGPITDKIEARLAFQYEERDGFVESQIPAFADLDDKDLSTVRGKIFFKPTDRLSIKVMADYIDKEDHEGQSFLPLTSVVVPIATLFGGVVPTGDYYSSTTNIGDAQKNEVKAGGGEIRVDYEFDGFTLSSITGYRKTETAGFSEIGGTSAPFLRARTLGEQSDDWSQEIQAVSSDDGPLNWVVGLYYWNEEASINSGLSGLGIGPGIFSGANAELDIESLAPYAQVSYEITPQWEVSVGARYTDVEKELNQNVNYVTGLAGDGWTPVFPALLSFDTGSDKFSSETFAPKVGLTWRPMENVMLYASYAKGYKSGGFSLPALGAPPAVVDEEKVETFELGWKTEFGSLVFNGAIFRNELDDLQVIATNSQSGLVAVQNAATATSQGFEASIDYALTDDLLVGVGVAYLDATYDDFPGGQVLTSCLDAPTNPICIAQFGTGAFETSEDLSGNELPYSPEWTSTLRINYSKALPDSLGRLDFSLNGIYKSKFYNTVDNNSLLAQDSQFLLSAAIGWTSVDDHFNFRVFGTNLTDEEYTTVSFAAPFIAYYGPAAPRMVAAKVSYRF